MNNLVDPLCSEKINMVFIKDILEPSFKNMCSTIVAFSGSGNTLELRYLIKNIHSLPEYKEKHLFTFLDLVLLEETPSVAFSEALVFLKNTFGADLDEDTLKYIDNLVGVDDITPALFFEFVNKAITQGFEITFVIDNAHRLYLTHENTAKLQSIIMSLRRLHTGKVSFIFIAFYEFDAHAVELLKTIGPLFTQNFIHGVDILFDEASAQLSFDYQEKWNKAVFLLEFKSKLAKLCLGDASILRIIENKAISDLEFQKSFINTEDIGDLYSLSGKENLDNRFKKLMSTLSDDSLRCLRNKLANPTDFLLVTGLVLQDTNEEYICVHVFLSYFLRKFDFAQLTKNPIAVVTKSPSSKAKSFLTGQEMYVFNLLESKPGQLVSRDEIAKAMWGEESDQKYSDWAIDQVISRMRFKLEQVAYPEKIKTIKGKGFMLKV